MESFDVAVVGMGALGSAAAYHLAPSGREGRRLRAVRTRARPRCLARHLADRPDVVRRSAVRATRAVGVPRLGRPRAGIGRAVAHHHRRGHLPARRRALLGHRLHRGPGGVRCPARTADAGRGAGAVAAVPDPRERRDRLHRRHRHRPRGAHRRDAAAPCSSTRGGHPRPHPGRRADPRRRRGRGADLQRPGACRQGRPGRRCLGERAARTPWRGDPTRRHAGAGHLLPPGRRRAARSRAVPGVDLGGRGVLLRLPDLRGTDGEGRTRRLGEPHVAGGAHLRPVAGPHRAAGRLHGGPRAGVGPRAPHGDLSVRATPDRNFVLGPLEEHPDVIVALAAGHGFKFTPAFGRILAELALDGETSDDISSFAPSHARSADRVSPMPTSAS